MMPHEYEGLQREGGTVTQEPAGLLPLIGDIMSAAVVFNL